MSEHILKITPKALPEIEVIAVVSNPMRYESRYRLYKMFEEDLKQQDCRPRLWTVELQHGMRPTQITNSFNEQHLQLWTTALPGEIWHKENLINVALGYLTSKVPNWRYVAWVDADFKFEPDAFSKTIEALQHYDVVQMWSHLINLSPHGGIIQSKVGVSFMYSLLNNNLNVTPPGKYPQWIGSPGGAWATRRESINKLGTALGSPLIDWGILGSGDLYFAEAVNGIAHYGIDKRFARDYVDSIYHFQNNAVAGLKKNIGYVENTVRHMFHGRTVDRQYETRGQILIKYQFNPLTDLKKDVSGIWQLVVNSERQMKLRDACRRYFKVRNEDANVI